MPPLTLTDPSASCDAKLFAAWDSHDKHARPIRKTQQCFRCALHSLSSPPVIWHDGLGGDDVYGLCINGPAVEVSADLFDHPGLSQSSDGGSYRNFVALSPFESSSKSD